MSNKRSDTRAPVMLRIKLRYPDVDTFIGKFTTNVSRGGMFIASRKPKAIGSQIRFELQLADGEPIIGGEGVVRWVRDYDETRPRQPHGMGIEFSTLSAQSAAAIDRIVESREQRGLDPDAIPMAEKRPDAEPQKPNKRAKRNTKRPDNQKKRRRGRKTTKSPANKRPDEQPPEDAPTLADTDRQLAAILETDDASIAAMILRAREIARAAGDDADLDALLRVPPLPPPPPPPPRAREPALGPLAEGTAEPDTFVGAEPNAAMKPLPEDEDPITIDEPTGVAHTLDDLARGTPPPPNIPGALDIEPILEPRGGGDRTYVESSTPDSTPMEFDAEATPLPPPVPAEEQEATPGEFKPPPSSADVQLSQELAVDVMNVDDLIASGLDELPSGPAPAFAAADEFSEESPTNVVDGRIAGGRIADAPTDGDIPTDIVDRDDDEVNAALDSLLGESLISDNAQDITAVRDETGQSAIPVIDDGIEIDLDEDTGVGDVPEDDPDSGDKKSGFFKRMFRKN